MTIFVAACKNIQKKQPVTVRMVDMSLQIIRLILLLMFAISVYAKVTEGSDGVTVVGQARQDTAMYNLSSSRESRQFLNSSAENLVVLKRSKSKATIQRSRRTKRKTFTGFTEKDKEGYVREHNKVRREVDVEASNMMKLEWDDGVAATAQAWVDKCNFAHSTGSGNGENLFMGGAPYYEPVKVTGAWAKEIKYFEYSEEFIYNPKAGHYTQQIWADTNKIGCGAKWCPNKKASMVCCQYSPPGNVIGGVLYKEGSQCSQCPPGVGCDDGLCGANAASPSGRLFAIISAVYFLFSGAI